MVLSVPPGVATTVAAVLLAGVAAMAHRVWQPPVLRAPHPAWSNPVIPAVRFDRAPLKDALAFFEQYCGPIHLADNAEKIVRSGEFPVTTRLRNVRACKALRAVLDASGSELRYQTDEATGAIRIEHKSDWPAQFVDAECWVGLLVAPGGFADGYTWEEFDDQLTGLIRETIAVESWSLPGTALRLDEPTRTLHIRNTPDTIRDIDTLLGQLQDNTARQPFESLLELP